LHRSRLRIAGDLARLLMAPVASETRGPATTFFRRSADAWVFVTAGSAFTKEQLQRESVPQALWPDGESGADRNNERGRPAIASRDALRFLVPASRFLR
jgi:hypothetical protein